MWFSMWETIMICDRLMKLLNARTYIYMYFLERFYGEFFRTFIEVRVFMESFLLEMRNAALKKEMQHFGKIACLLRGRGVVLRIRGTSREGFLWKVFIEIFNGEFFMESLIWRVFIESFLWRVFYKGVLKKRFLLRFWRVLYGEFYMESFL